MFWFDVQATYIPTAEDGRWETVANEFQSMNAESCGTLRARELVPLQPQM